MLPLPSGGFWHLLELACGSALVGGLAAIERKGALQLMLSRPLVLGPLLGWALGDPVGGLWLGAPLELLFLGGVNLGGSVPENETLLCTGLVAACVLAGLAAGTGTDEPMRGLGLALLYPLALAGRWLEQAMERRNVALLERARAEIRAGDPGASRSNLVGLVYSFASAAVIGLVCAMLAPLLALVRLHLSHRLELGLHAAWQAFYALSLAAAVRAIRDRRALKLSGAAVVLFLGIGLAFGRLPVGWFGGLLGAER
jgi:mannose/fructose/N-acetylgalactosamine-specific phosphotransferase system component IIC